MESKKIKVELLLATKGHQDSTNGLLTFQIEIPYFVWVEFLTHKRTSRNLSSARAQSTSRHLAHGYFIPDVFYQDQKGMESTDIPIENQERAKEIWLSVWEFCSKAALELESLKVCKEQRNRVIPPFKMVRGVVTATQDAWHKFLRLRTNKNADKAMQDFARKLENWFIVAGLDLDFWTISTEHIPMIKENEGFETLEQKILTSAARIARVSYERPREGKNDLELADMLKTSEHWSPFEHIAIYSQSYHPSSLCSKPKDIWNGWSWSNWRSLIE